MQEFVLWVEGADFSECLFDTNDLSTIRGASLAMLALPHRISQSLLDELGDQAVHEIFSGASQAALRLCSNDGPKLPGVVAKVLADIADEGLEPELVGSRAKAASREPGSMPAAAPFAHLRLIWGLAKHDGDADRALKLAQASARVMQLQEDGPRRVSTTKAGLPCPIDRRRPATAAIWVKKDADPADRHAMGSDEAGDSKTRSQRLAVSVSVAARRHYGRWARQGFYAAELGLTAQAASELGFADSLHDIVADPPDGTPLALRQKLAVFYADGNKFGRVRTDLSAKKGVFEGLELFSRELKHLQREFLLKRFLNELRGESAAGGERARRVAFSQEDRPKLPQQLLRLETLLWGGDELTWVVPAWLGWWVAERFFDWTGTNEWQIGGNLLTYSAGLAFVSYKTPIRDATRMARDLADIAKSNDPSGQTGALEVEVFESVEVPLDGISGLRQRIGGVGPDEGAEHALTIEAAEVSSFVQRLRSLKAPSSARDSLPRSQIYRVLQQIRQAGLKPAQAGEKVHSELGRYRDRTGRGHGDESFALTKRLASADNAGLNLYSIAQHWDYVEPFLARDIAKKAEAHQ